MPIGRNSKSIAVLSKAACLLMWLVPLAGTAYGQEDRAYPKPRPDKYAYAADPGNVPDAIAKVKSGDFLGVHVEMIAAARAVEAIPVLKDQFLRSQDSLDKAHIASALVRLGEKDDTYWEYLVTVATPGIDGEVPDLFSYDAQGKPALGAGPSPEMAAWAKSHNVSLERDPIEVMGSIVGPVKYLAMTGDPRAIPLLRRALLSPNYMIENQAALGLAEAQDVDSIPLIVMACKRAPAEAAGLIAVSLIYFDAAGAQSAAARYIAKDMAKMYREARAAGKTPFQ
jgi:hypothetical protein